MKKSCPYWIFAALLVGGVFLSLRPSSSAAEGTATRLPPIFAEGASVQPAGGAVVRIREVREEWILQDNGLWVNVPAFSAAWKAVAAEGKIEQPGAGR